MNIGILPLGRPTFDVEYAEQKLDQMLLAFERSGHQITGSRSLLFDDIAFLEATNQLKQQSIDQLVILQVTFTDTSMTVAAATEFEQPLSIWAIPEPREGGRLRLNAFCGLNLASHALSKKGLSFSWMYADPCAEIATELHAMLNGQCTATHLRAGQADIFDSAAGQQVAEAIRGKRIARIGKHPGGFDTCTYSTTDLTELAGVKVDELELDDLFSAANNASVEQTQQARQLAESSLEGLEKVHAQELDKSLRLKVGLDSMRDNDSYDAFAIRCWPETFTEYGAAVCGPAAMMSEAGTPCACEADVYGSLSQLIMQEASGNAVFLTDLVDVDRVDNSAVVWHCGQAPVSMRDPDIEATATIHTNRKKPLLYEFPLKPGAVTLMRISQSFNETKMVLAYAEMLKRPMAFTGTSGVLRFERDAEQVLGDIIDSGLEHHMVLAYGDHRSVLRAVAAAMKLPLLEI